MGESVTEATVSKWFKKQGDAVKRDEPILELETDKVTVEVPAPADGSIESIAVKEGDTVQVGTVLGAIAEGKAGTKSAAVARNPDAAVAVPATQKAVAAIPEPSPPKPEVKVSPAPALAMPSARRVAE